MIEYQISGYFHNEPFSESNEEKCMPFKVWLGPLLLMKILIKTAQLVSKYFPSGLSFGIHNFLFHKVKDTSAISQPSLQDLLKCAFTPVRLQIILCKSE